MTDSAVEAARKDADHFLRCESESEMQRLVKGAPGKVQRLARVYLSSQAEVERMRAVAVSAAMGAQLPDNYQWGEDALEAFNFGKTCAANAVEATLTKEEK